MMIRTFLATTLFFALTSHATLNTIDTFSDGVTAGVHLPLFPAKDGNFYLSQTSDPDGVCKWLGLGDFVEMNSLPTYLAEDKTKLHDGLWSVEVTAQGTFGRYEKSDVVTSIACRKPRPVAATGDYSRKLKMTSGYLLDYPVFHTFSTRKPSFYSADSNLEGVCKLYGYKKALEKQIDDQFDLQETRGKVSGSILVDSKGAYAPTPKSSAPWRDGRDVLRTLTCE